ncbi:MAG: hypothetical protein JW843_02035, partial [Candidatus Aminicenantes bacterium]|nr:hypothetical protein [Candidatus Aminicenantes bacterium]
MSRQNKTIALSAFLFLFFGWGTAVPASAQGYADETGFIQIDPVNYFFHMGSYYARLDLVSSPARIWYS